MKDRPASPRWVDDGSDIRARWVLDPTVTFLNHGSFGACPKDVLEVQSQWRMEMERQPVEFLDRRLPGFVDDARQEVAAFLEADPGGLVFVPNATAAVAAVLASAGLSPGDQVVVTDHAYGAVRKACHRACASAGADLVVTRVPLPLPAPGEVVDLVMASVSERTRLVVLDHVTSPTAAILPVDDVVRACRDRGVRCLVDAAHAPGMLPIDLGVLDPDLWIGNLHKWVCAPKGAAALWVRPELRSAIHPAVTSHGMGEGLHREFDWRGTDDPTAFLSVPSALRFMSKLGWDRVREHNRGLARFGREVVADAMGTEQLVPDEAAGSMTVVALPPGGPATVDGCRSLQARLYKEDRIEVPVFSWNDRGLVRLSAHVYNTPEEYERLAGALAGLLR